MRILKNKKDMIPYSGENQSKTQQQTDSDRGALTNKEKDRNKSCTFFKGAAHYRTVALASKFARNFLMLLVMR